MKQKQGTDNKAPASIAGAFLTGSQIYGEPNDSSDVDLVVLVDGPTAIGLIALSDEADLSEMLPSIRSRRQRSGTGSASRTGSRSNLT